MLRITDVNALRAVMNLQANPQEEVIVARVLQSIANIAELSFGGKIFQARVDGAPPDPGLWLFKVKFDNQRQLIELKPVQELPAATNPTNETIAALKAFNYNSIADLLINEEIKPLPENIQKFVQVMEQFRKEYGVYPHPKAITLLMARQLPISSGTIVLAWLAQDDKLRDQLWSRLSKNDVFIRKQLVATAQDDAKTLIAKLLKLGNNQSFNEVFKENNVPNDLLKNYVTPKNMQADPKPLTQVPTETQPQTVNETTTSNPTSTVPKSPVNPANTPQTPVTRQTDSNAVADKILPTLKTTVPPQNTTTVLEGTKANLADEIFSTNPLTTLLQALQPEGETSEPQPTQITHCAKLTEEVPGESKTASAAQMPKPTANPDPLVQSKLTKQPLTTHQPVNQKLSTGLQDEPVIVNTTPNTPAEETVLNRETVETKTNKEQLFFLLKESIGLVKNSNQESNTFHLNIVPFVMVDARNQVHESLIEWQEKKQLIAGREVTEQKIRMVIPTENLGEIGLLLITQGSKAKIQFEVRSEPIRRWLSDRCQELKKTINSREVNVGVVVRQALNRAGSEVDLTL